MRFNTIINYCRTRANTQTPRDAWKTQAREALLAEIRQSPAWKHGTRTHSIARVFDVFSFSSAMSVLKPIGVSALIIAIVSTSSLATVQAAQASLPGDALYSVKLGIERAQVILASTENKKAALEVGFANTRLEEVGEIVASDTTEDTSNRVAVAMEQFTKDLASVQERLVKLGENAETTDQAVVVSKLVNESTQKIEESLQDIKVTIEQKTAASLESDKAAEAAILNSVAIESENPTSSIVVQQASSTTMSSDIITTSTPATAQQKDGRTDAEKKQDTVTSTALLKTLDTAITAVEKVNTKSLEVLVDKAEHSGNATLKAEAVQTLQKKIEKIEKAIVATEQKLEAVTTQAKESAQATTQVVPVAQGASSTPATIITNETSTPVQTGTESNASSTPAVKDPVVADALSVTKAIESVQEKPNQAKESIEQAKKIITEQGSDDLSGILQKVKNAKDIVNEADNTIKQVVETITAPATIIQTDIKEGKVLGEQVIAPASTTPNRLSTEKTAITSTISTSTQEIIKKATTQ